MDGGDRTTIANLPYETSYRFQWESRVTWLWAKDII